jgi:hypothetical protein
MDQIHACRGSQSELLGQTAPDREIAPDVGDPSRSRGGAAKLLGMLEIVTVIFKSGSALLSFYTALRAVMEKRASAATVSEPATGKVIGRITGNTTDAALAKLAR